jgi:type IV secretory pathway TrbF-like protein
MKSPFISNPVPMKPLSPPETAFRAAQQAWDLRLGSAVVSARNWRFACLSTLALLGLTAATLLALINQQRVIPVLVGVDKETGEARTLGPVEQTQYQPGELEVKYFLAQFIRNVRSVPLDPVVIRQNWVKTYAFLRADAAALLNEMTQKDPNSPINKIGKVLITVQPLSIVKIPDTSSYQLRWQETVFSPHGQKEDEYTMLATVIIELDPPKDEQTLQDNPLGLFIKNFQWNREL